MVAETARRTRLIGLASFACGICVWLGVAAPAYGMITSISVGNQSLQENQHFSGTVATFTTDNPLATAWTYSIDWGDGTTDTGSATVMGDNGSVSGSHTYAEDGSYPLKVTVTETGGGSPGSKSATATVTVNEGDLVLAAGSPATLSEGSTFAGPVASFIDSGSPDTASKFTATIDWGDGTTIAGTVTGGGGNFTVSGSHTYTDELPNGFITVTVSEAEGNATVGPVQTKVNVADADALSGHASTFPASDGVPFSGAVASFSDTAGTPAGDFTATIDWGDGASSSGTVTQSGGMLTVSGTHTYNSPPSGYPVKVTLTDDSPGAATANAASTANVSASQPAVTTLGASGVTINGASLDGTVNPNGDATSYSFQYGTTAAYGSTSSSGSAGSGNSGVPVSGSISGLTPGTIYHYRIVATNSKGTTVGADQTFTTKALVSSVKGRRDGSFVVVVNAPGPGTVNAAVMDGNRVFGRAHATAKHAGNLTIHVRPNRRGRRLIKHHRHRITFQMSVTFTPQGGRSTTVTIVGLHLPA